MYIFHGWMGRVGGCIFWVARGGWTFFMGRWGGGGRVGMFTGFSITYNLSFLLDIEFTVDAMVPCRHMV